MIGAAWLGRVAGSATDSAIGIVAEVAQPLRRNRDTAAALRPMMRDGAGVCPHPGPRAPRQRRELSMATKQRRGVTDAESTRVNIRLSVAAHQRLSVHALMAGMTPGRLVERLIEEHLKSWRVQSVQANRSINVPLDGRLEIDAGVSRESPETVAA
jgi:hypothetical protein